jgi:manganese/zinc/iron transport system ATP- binding protein
MIIHASNPVLEVHDLTVSYHNKPVLWSVDFSLPAGVLVGVLGPNGAGKSTLIKSIMGLLPIGAGYVKVFDKSLHEVRSKVSYVPQRESVDWDYPINALEVVLMGRYHKMGWLKWPRKADKDAAFEALQTVGMEGFANRHISQLSGGQQQRVFLARALAQEADFYLMDEPFTGVDATTEATIISVLRNIVKQGKTVVLVHHDLQSVTEYFDWTVLVNMHLVASGPTKEVFNSELLQKTYGGKLSLLSHLGELLQKQQFPNRE